MAHFAEIDANNVVTRVLVTDNDAPNEGYDWLVETFGGTWIQTSYNKNFRRTFAGIGSIYDTEEDAFMPPQPFPSWTFDKESWLWIAPVAAPETQDVYVWDESSQSWTILGP
jgi:hypothetical protein